MEKIEKQSKESPKTASKNSSYKNSPRLKKQINDSNRQNRLHILSTDNTKSEVTNSESMQRGSMSAIQQINQDTQPIMDHQNMPTSLDRLYPNNLKSQFRNPLALAPIKIKRAGKGKSKTSIK